MSALVDEVRLVRLLPPPEMARAIRRTAGVSQRRMARELGVDTSAVSRWEAGAVQPRGERRLAYARLLRALAEASGT